MTRMVSGILLIYIMLIGIKFSDFSLISDVTLTALKIIFEIISLEHFSHDFMIDSDFQK